MKRFILFLGLITMTSTFIMAQGSGGMLDYNGTSSFVNCGTINLSGSNLTLLGWVKVDNFKSAHPYISSLWGTEKPGAQAMVRLGDAGLAKEKVQFVIYNGSTHYKLNGNKSLTANRWYHIAATYDGSTMRIYINGVLDVSRSVSTTIVSNNTFEIGKQYATSRTLDGKIDEVSVWKATLSQATIRDWMCQSINRYHPNYSNLEGYWKFDEGSGTTTKDHSTKTHNGTLVSSPAWRTSEVPIGDTSVANYTTPFNLKLAHDEGDSMVISSVTGNPSSAHLYLINKKPNNATFPSGISVYDTTRYWGVFYAEGSNPRGNVAYYYGPNTNYQANASCMMDLATRANNASTSWALANSSQSSSNLSKSAQGSSEYTMIYRSNKVIHKDPSETICDGDSVELKHSTTGLTYTWYLNNNVIPGQTSNTFMAKQAGLYKLTINTGNCVDTSFDFQLIVTQKPSVTFASQKAVCPNLFVDTISGGLPIGGKYKHTYMSGNLFVVKTAGPGEHKIIYEYTDANGCSDTASSIKKVHDWPPVSIGGLPDMCEDTNSFTLNTGSPAGGTYYINGNLSLMFDAASLGNGNHKILYNYTDTNGCPGSDSTQVVVKSLPNVVLNLIKTQACEGDPDIYLDGQNPRGGIFSGTGVSGFNFKVKTAGAGNHPITYTYRDKNNQCYNSAVDTIFVNPIPAKPTITFVGDSLVCSNSELYFWYDMNGRILTATAQSYKPEKTGDYYVVVREKGCTSPRSDTIYYQATSVFAISDESRSKVYPNPTKDYVLIEGLTTSSAAIDLIDLTGQVVFTKSGIGIKKLELPELPSGAYILQIKAGNSVTRTRLIIE